MSRFLGIRELAQQGLALHEDGMPERAVCEALITALDALEARDAEVAALTEQVEALRADRDEHRTNAKAMWDAWHKALADADSLRAECERLKQELQRATEITCVRPCAKHEGQPFAIQAHVGGVTRYVCPLCDAAPREEQKR